MKFCLAAFINVTGTNERISSTFDPYLRRAG
jgi:hypothetical protein